MNGSITSGIEVWEGEGGAAPAIPMTGTVDQVECAERINWQVSDRFDHATASFLPIADQQDHAERADTIAIIAILEDRCAEVTIREQPGEQVRQMIIHDLRLFAPDAVRYQAINREQCSTATIRWSIQL